MIIIIKERLSSNYSKFQIIRRTNNTVSQFVKKNNSQTLLREVFALQTRLLCSVPLFVFLDGGCCCCCCFFFFCFFFTTFSLPESDEESSDVVLSQKTSRRHARVLVVFASMLVFTPTPTQVEATAPTPRNFRRDSSFRCGRCGCLDTVDVASSFNESASIVKKEEVLVILASLPREFRFTARCQSSFAFFLLDGFCPSVRVDAFNWDAFRNFFRVFLASSLSAS